MEEQAREGRKREEQKLKAQLRMVVAYWYHGCREGGVQKSLATRLLHI